MSQNPQLGYTELAAAQAQPEVPVVAAERFITQLVAGQITIEFTSDADRTLAAPNPLTGSAEWCFAVIQMTDSVGPTLTAARAVIYPNVDSLYGGPSRHHFTFINSTAQTLTIKRSGQTGVAVPAGASRLVRHNGTDIELVAASGSGSAAVLIQVACSETDEPLPASTTVAAYFRAPQAFDIDDLRASLGTTSGSGDVEIDIHVNGSSILADPIVIDAGELTSVTSASPFAINTGDVHVPDDALVEIYVLDDGDGAARGLIVTVYGTP